MKLIFLHGPPASGKYTIARVLQETHGVLNFHNHLTIDVAKALFEFGTPEFWALTHRLRRTALAARAEHGAANVVFTNCYSSPHDDATVDALEHEVTSRDGAFVPVFLECTPEELRRRVVEPSRHEMGKLRSVEGLEEYLAAWNVVALERPDTISIRTDGRSPEDCAEEIARRTLR
ncbi:MAG: AAA family ATPase [Longimicrobiales bacterium]